MDIFALSEKLMGMDSEAWARHANPWSVWTRITGGTGVFIAIWSYHWIGWYSAIAIVLALSWWWSIHDFSRYPNTLTRGLPRACWAKGFPQSEKGADT